jgi:PmbA protein
MSEKEILDRVLNVLRDRGSEGDAWIEHRRTLAIQVRDGVLDSIQRADTRGLAVRAMNGLRLGFVHTAQVDLDGAATAAENAVALSAAAGERDDLALADPAGPGDGRDEGEALGLYDPTFESLGIAEKEEWLRRAERSARALDERIRRTESCGYSETLGGYWLANTRGLFRHFRKSAAEVGIEVVAEEGDEKQPGSRFAKVVRRDDLPDPDLLGRDAGERAVRLLGGRPVETGRYPVVFAPQSGWALLVYLQLALNGDAVSRRRSWLVDRMAERIGGDHFTVYDDGRRSAGVASMPFDGEGVDTRSTCLVEKGWVKGKILDLASAKRLAESSTGNATREGYQNLPQIGTHNLYLASGGRSRDEIIGSVERGLWVWGLSGWWIGLDPTNTQFSSAASGLWIENGKAVRPVARVTIAGELSETFGAIDAVADDIEWTNDTVTPTYRVAGMMVSGAG